MNTLRHEVVIRRNDDKWQGLCRGCGAHSPASTHKPVVEAWRTQHYREVNR
jgi:hypothetical protein